MKEFDFPDLKVFQSALFCTNTTVIQTPDLVLVVDPNWLPPEIAQIKSYVNAIQENRPLFLLFTHSDYDHIIGWKAFPDAQIIASQAFEDNPDKEKILEQIRTFDDEYYIERNYPIEYPLVDFTIKKDGQRLKIGHTELFFYLAPGHNPDGIFTIINGIWIAGDYFCDVEFPYIYHSSIEYEKTILKMNAILETHPIKTLIPGHGSVTASIKEMQKRKDESLKYLREVREHLKTGKHFDLNSLGPVYKFPRIMQKFHDANLDLFRKELNLPENAK